MRVGARQERGRRSGTENTPGIIGLGKACKPAGRRIDAESARIAQLRERLEAGIREQVPNAGVRLTMRRPTHYIINLMMRGPRTRKNRLYVLLMLTAGLSFLLFPMASTAGAGTKACRLKAAGYPEKGAASDEGCACCKKENGAKGPRCGLMAGCNPTGDDLSVVSRSNAESPVFSSGQVFTSSHATSSQIKDATKIILMKAITYLINLNLLC